MQVYVDFLSELGHPEAEQRAEQLEQLRQRLAAEQGTAPVQGNDDR
jgi:hypothetical protein